MPSFTHSLNIIGRCTQMERSDKLKRLGGCGGQVPYLLRLCRRPGLSQEEIAQALYLNKSSVARQIPTEKALSMLPLLVETVRGWNDYLLDGMDADERAQLEAIMERISARARAYIEREVGWDG